MKDSLFRFIICLLSIVFIVSCKTNENIPAQSMNPDGRYDSEFPDKSVSDKLNEISKTIKKLDCLAFYMTYVFPPDNQLRRGAITKENIKEMSVSADVTNQSVAGTAAVIYYDGATIGLLTCAHVVDYPDTIFNWYDDEETILQSISVKVRQQNYISGLPDGDDIEIVVLDQKNDIALLKRNLHSHTEKPDVFTYKAGNTQELEWGTFVYIMGYPLGNLMVTRAIVSNPDKTKNGVFLTDALYNKGISGSPVFALRDGVPNFEWIGMAKSAAAENYMYLEPDSDMVKVTHAKYPYEGVFYANKKLAINYGVTFSVTIEAIEVFFRKNKQAIENAGFNIEDILP
ncbi:MAG: serine protease [Bacteroidetes bacterium]|nr:serine protease [Bacteroidota bacterium]